MALVIEVLDKQKRVMHRYFFHHSSITIGRGYHNDVILDDVHVDELHAVLTFDDTTGFTLADQDSVNGIRDKKKKKLAGATTFHEARDFYLGETRIRIIDSSLPIPDAIDLKQDFWLSKMANSLLAALVLLVVVNLQFAYSTFVSSTEDIEFVKYLQACSWLTLGVAIIAVSVSFIGKVVRREWRFSFNLFFFCCFGLVAETGDFILGVVTYNTYMVKSFWLVQALWWWCLVAFLVWGLMQSTLQIKPRYQKVVIAGIASVAFGFIVIDQKYNETVAYHAKPPITLTFKPDLYRWAAPQSDKAFIENASSVFDIDVSAE